MTFRPYKPRDYGSTKDVVTRVFDVVDGGLKRVAFALDRSPSQTQAYSDPASAEELTLGQARRLADLSGAAAAVLADDFAALAGGVFLPCGTATGRFEGLVAKSSAEWGEFIAALLDALADGHLCVADRRRVLAELDDVLHALAAARAELMHAGSGPVTPDVASTATASRPSTPARPTRGRR